MFLSAREVYNLARGVGLTHDQAITATAIAWAESGLDTTARGDVSLQNATWGPSLGLWQVRSIKADLGTGKPRDAAQLYRPGFNARSMASISGGGRNWSPWTTYTAGTYRKHLTAVSKAVGADPNPTAPPAGKAPTVDPAGWIDDLGDAVTGGPVRRATADALGLDVRDLVLTGVVVAGGLLLVLAGAAVAAKGGAS